MGPVSLGGRLSSLPVPLSLLFSVGINNTAVNILSARPPPTPAIIQAPHGEQGRRKAKLDVNAELSRALSAEVEAGVCVEAQSSPEATLRTLGVPRRGSSSQRHHPLPSFSWASPGAGCGHLLDPSLSSRTHWAMGNTK